MFSAARASDSTVREGTNFKNVMIYWKMYKKSCMENMRMSATKKF